METHWEFIESVRKALGSEIVTGGGSGTHLFDLANGPFTEIQPGSYLFMDSQYCDVEIGTHFDVSLTVLSRVTSATKRNQVVIDAGAKSMSTDVAVMRFLNHDLRAAAHRFMGMSIAPSLSLKAPSVRVLENPFKWLRLTVTRPSIFMTFTTCSAVGDFLTYGPSRRAVIEEEP